MSASRTIAPLAAPGLAFRPLATGFGRCVGVDARVEQLVEMRRIDPDDGLLARDDALVDHVHRGLDRRRCGALGCPRLEHVEHVVLDGELDVLHVSVVLLEPAHRREELLVGGRHEDAHRLDGLRRADAGDDVLALRVHEELAVDLLLAGRRVARERDAGSGAVALVAEHHLDDVDRRAEIVGDVVGAAIDLRARRLPRVEHRADRAHQLVGRILGEIGALRGAVDAAVGLDQLCEVVVGEVGVELGAALALERAQRILERVAVDPVDDLPEHLDQPPVGVEGEPSVSRAGCEALDRLVVQPEVENRVHHPGHRDRRSRAHRDEQRVARVAEALAGLLLQAPHVLCHLGVEAVGEIRARHVGAARVGGDRETGGHGQPERRHLREADPLAAEQFATAVGGLVEVIDETPEGHVGFLSVSGGGAPGTRRARQETVAQTRTV